MEKYSKVYILSFPLDILRRCRYFCEFSVCELNASTCFPAEGSKQLGRGLSQGRAFSQHSYFVATIPKMSLNFGVYIKRRHLILFLVSRSAIPRTMASLACRATPTGPGP